MAGWTASDGGKLRWHGALQVDGKIEAPTVEGGEGTIQKVPVNDKDIVNKEYVDDEISGAKLWEIEDATTIKTKEGYKNVLIATTTDTSPEIIMTSNNDTRGIKIELDKDGGNDDLEIIGQTAGKNTELCVKALDGENASLRLYSGTNYANLYYHSSDKLVIKNTVEDQDIEFQFDDGGVAKTITIDASANEMNMGDTSLTTTGKISGASMFSGALAVLTTNHSNDSSDPHGATLTQTIISLTSGAVTGDMETSGAVYIAPVIFASGAKHIAASNYPKGTLAIEYTA